MQNSVNCINWARCDSFDGGCCSNPPSIDYIDADGNKQTAYASRPSFGFCSNCKERQPINSNLDVLFQINVNRPLSISVDVNPKAHTVEINDCGCGRGKAANSRTK